CTVTLLFVVPLRLPCSTLFPYTTLFRSSDKHKLAVSLLAARVPIEVIEQVVGLGRGRINQIKTHPEAQVLRDQITTEVIRELTRDRKSTRLNSSHVKISYAVFCLKKKNN